MGVALETQVCDSEYSPPEGVAFKVADFEGMTERLGEFDLLHDHGLWLPCNHRIANAARALELPRIVSPRGMLEPWALNHKKWKKKIAWQLYQKKDLETAACLHATAESEAEQLRELGLRAPIAVIPNGVDEMDHDAQFKIQSNNGPYTALFLSRIHPKKGLPLLIEAWAKVKPTGWRMRVVGPEEAGHLSELKELVVKAGLEESWQFEGPLDGESKWQAYSEADLFILPTYSENFGIVVAEALAAGVPVITTQGTPWIQLQTKGCGWWVSADSSSIANALGEAVTLPRKELREMGARGRSLVKRDYSWDRIGEQMRDCYLWLLGRGSKPSFVIE